MYKMLSAFLLTLDEDDPNIELSSVEVEKRHKEAKNLIAGIEYISENLSNVSNEPIDIQTVFYDAGKKFFGEDKSELQRFFKVLYMLLFETVTGPRWGTFVAAMGKDNFENFIRDRMNNPFRFP